MNNILTFEDYKKMNIRQVESVIYHQFIEDNIDDEDIVNEGFIRNAINKASSNFIQTALADEIEKGKELEKSIKEALDGLNKGFDEIEKKINKNDKNSKSNLAAIEKVKEAIKAVQSQAFDTLTMIGSEGEIDFAGFMGSASVAAAANFGILFTPIRSLFITRKAYKYFLGIIKQTIRRNLLIIQLNFDQFENLILQKSFETDNDSESETMRETLNGIIIAMQRELIGKDSKLKFTGKKGEEMRKYLSNFKETQNALIRQHKEDTKNNPLRSLWEDQHNNTYTRTLEQIKQYINDDSQKELDALKNSITKMAGNDVELGPYGELLISAAEEYAVHTNHGINNNFIKMSSVFNLENQKKLIDLIVETQKENEAEIRKKEQSKINKQKKEEFENNIQEGKKLYEEKLKDNDEKYSFDKFNDIFDDSDIKCLNMFFISDEGKEAYDNLIEKFPTYKYFLTEDVLTLYNFLQSFDNLEVIETESLSNFNKNIVEKDQTLYYMMAERSIDDAIENKKSENYFGFNIKETHEEKDEEGNPIIVDNIEDNILIYTTEQNNCLETTFGKYNQSTSRNPVKKYFLKIKTDSGLFDILHKKFKSKIFKSGGKYVNNISTENKLDIMKIINKHLKIGNSISEKFAKYLVRLEAHMLLKQQEPWFVVKNNEILKKCFKPNAEKIQNKHAFVELSEKDYNEVKEFLEKYKRLHDNDFNIEKSEKDTKE